jgi:hypothetical protein
MGRVVGDEGDEGPCWEVLDDEETALGAEREVAFKHHEKLGLLEKGARRDSANEHAHSCLIEDSSVLSQCYDDFLFEMRVSYVYYYARSTLLLFILNNKPEKVKTCYSFSTTSQER